MHIEHTTPSAADTKVILVLVHPGSACGSADFNLGKAEGRAARDMLCSEMDSWNGDLIVIDGALSDELDHYPVLDASIKSALDRAKKADVISIRAYGDDPDQVDVIKALVPQLGARGIQAQYVVTGAWYHPEDGSGCVGSVIEALAEIGCEAKVSESAVSLSLYADEPDLMDGPSF
jgi:hypothetical protein